MDPAAQQLTDVLAPLTLVADLGIAFLVVLLLAARQKNAGLETARLIEKHALGAAFLVALGASALSLVYSDIFGMLPCGLCWAQRVFMYPLVVLLGIAAWKNDPRIVDYVIPLSALGAIISLYHHYIQMGGAEFVACPTAGGDCGQRFIFEYGFVTFPWMSLTAFGLVILLMLFLKRVHEKTLSR